MKIKNLAFALPIAAFAAGCPADQGSAFIQGVLFADPGDECVVSPNGQGAFLSNGVLDIGNGNADTANQFVAPLQVVSNLPSTFQTQDVTESNEESPSFQDYGNIDANIITFSTAEVFFTTDADRDDQRALVNAGTPVAEDNPRVTTVAGTAFNENTQLLTESIVFATLITREDAGQLFNEPFVNEVVADDATATVRVVANILLRGRTTGNSDIFTPTFSFPIDLCSGCLVNSVNGVCPAGTQANDKCFEGQDVPDCS